MKTVYVIQVILFLMWSSATYGQAGSLDPDFGGGDGQVATSFLADKPSQAYAVAIDPTGRILVSGATRGADNRDHTVLVCYQPDGTLDPQFNGNGKMIISVDSANSFSQALAIQDDGRIILVVRAEYGPKTTLILHRFNPDGSPDQYFGGDGVVTADFGARYLSGRAIALQTDGKILVGGYIGNDEPFDKFYVARFHPDGTLDNQFDGDGMVSTFVGESYTHIVSLIVQPDGKIIAAGDAVFDQYDAFALVRYHADGNLDMSFGEGGIARATFGEGDDGAGGAVLQPDGKIVLGGYSYNTASGGDDFAAARFNADGTLDNSFHGDGMATVMVSEYADQARSILLQPDGKIVLGGYAHSNMPIVGPEMSLVRLNENGIPDISFNSDGIAIYEDSGTSGSIHKITLQSDGKIVGTGVIRTGELNAIRVARFITGLTVATAEENVTVSDIALFPNPAREQIRLQYQLETDETLTIQLCDMQGRILQELLQPSERRAGKYHEQLFLDQNLTTGNYLINMKTKSWVKAFQVVIE